MKKLFVRVVSLTLMLALVLSMPVIAQADSIDLGVSVKNGADTITVTVNNSAESNNILAAQKPDLTVACDFDEAYVKYGEKVVNSTLAGGKITFTVAKGGEYQIIKGSAPAYCTGCGSTDQYHEEDCEAIVPADAKPLYAYNLDDKKTYTSISTSNNAAIPVIFRTSEDATAEPIPLTDKGRFSFAGKGIDLFEGENFQIFTGAYGVSNGKIVYTAADGTVYVLPVTVTENKRLIAVDADGNYTEHWNISTTPVDATICYGTTTDYEEIPLDKLTTGGVAKLEGSGTNYKISATGAGQGGIYTTINDRIERYEVTGAGAWASGSLTAKNGNGEEVPCLMIAPGSTEKLALFFGDEKLTSTTGLTTGGVAKLTAYNNNDGLFRIEASARGHGDIYYTVNGYTYSYNIIGETNMGPGGPGQPGGGMASGTIEAEYNGQPVRIGLGLIGNEAVDFFTMMRDSYKAGTDHPYDFSLYLLAVQFDPENPKNISDVPKQFYSEISNVKIKVEPNGGEGSADNLQLTGPQKYDDVVEGADVWGFAAHADSCQGFDVNVTVTFDYQGVTYELPVWLSFVETSDITVGELTPGEVDENLPEGMPDKCLNTDEELNYILSGTGNLTDWLQYHYPEEYGMFGNWTGVMINLPAVTFEDVIKDQIVPYEGPNQFGGLALIGSSSGGKRTTMPGLICGDGVLGITGISFEKKEGETMRFGDSDPFTCGILVDTGRTSASSSGWISDCSFQGFDYGIYYTKHGVKPDVNGCLIRDCKYGLYVDSNGQTAVDFPLSVNNNRFVGCDEAAVEIKSLPSGYSPYYLRIYNNAFLFNDTEFKIDVSGTFFFKLNYYGGHSRGNGVYKNWTPDKKGDEEIRHAARLDIANKGSTKVITNPCLKEEDHTGGYWLYNNHGDAENQHTAILNSEADQILIDSDAFNQNSSESQVAILDENQNEMAMWIFDGEEAAE